VPAVLDLAPREPVALGLPHRAMAIVVVRPALAVNVVMMPLEMVESPDATMRLAAPDLLAAIARGDQVHRARLLVIAERLVPRVMMIATALPVTMIRLLTRMRRPVNLIALRGAS
jgi:hypothetical protein